MRKILIVHNPILVVLVILSLSLFLSGCIGIPSDILQKLGDLFKGKQEVSAPQTPVTEPVNIPQLLSEPTSAEPTPDESAPAESMPQEEAAEQPVARQAPASPVVINNYSSTAGASGIVPWWNAWSGGTLAPTTGNTPPAENPPAAGTEGIVVYSVGFIPEGSNQYAAQTTVGQRGTLYGWFANQYNTAKNLRGRILVDNVTVKDEVVSAPAESMNGFTVFPYAFRGEGSYTLWFSIDGLSDEDRQRNEATSTIMVGPPIFGPDPGPAAGSIDLSGSRINFVDNSNQLVTQATVGQSGKIKAAIFNSGNTTASNVLVQVTEDDIPSCQFTVPSIPPNQEASADDITYTFTAKGMRTLRLRVNPFNNPRETNIGNNNNCSIDIDVQEASASASEAPLTIAHLAVKNTDNGQDYPNDTCYISKAVTIYAQIRNNNDLPVNDVPIEFKVDENRLGQTLEYSFWPDQTLTPGFGKTFTNPGTYNIRVTIDPQNMKGRYCTQSKQIIVKTDRPEHVEKVIFCDKLGFMSSVSGREEDTVYAGDVGRVFARITNRGNQSVDNVRFVLKYDGVVVRDTGGQLSGMPPNYTTTLPENDVNRRMSEPRMYFLELDIDPDNIKGQKSYTQKYITVRPAEDHQVSGELKFYLNGSSEPADTIGINQTGRVNWIVRNQRWNEQRNVRIRVKVDDAQKEDKTVNLNRSPGRAEGWIENIRFGRIGNHSVELLIDEDKTTTKNITVTRADIVAETKHYNVTGSLILKKQDGTIPIFYDDSNMYKLEYTIKNNGREEIRGLPMQIKVDDAPRWERDVYIGPSPEKIVRYIDNFAFDIGGHHVIKMKLGEDFKYELPVEVISRERQWRYPTGSIALYNSRKEEVTTVAINENCRIRYALGNGANEAILNVDCKVTVDNAVKVSTKIDLHTGVRERALWIENIKFLDPGPHTIMLSWLRQDPVEGHEDVVEVRSHTQKIITALDESQLDETQHSQTSSEGSGHKMLEKKADARAGDIGFIPNGAKNYLDEIYQGEKGSLYGVFYNDSDADIKNIKMQILLDGRVIKESVKPLVKARGSETTKHSNYWFNELGSHKVSLVVDPGNKIKEEDEKNNRVTHTINVIRKPKPRTSSYDGAGAAAASDLLGSLVTPKKPGSPSSPPPTYTPGPTTYTPPKTPRVTTTTVDQGGSSSGGTTRKKPPTFTVKGLGK